MSKMVKINDEYVAVRQGLMERVWELNGLTMVNGFEVNVTLYVRGTENEMREYMESDNPFEFGYHYSAVDFNKAKKITNKIYIAPQIDDGKQIGNI